MAKGARRETFAQQVLRILNAPFTLWLLSIVFVSVGGTYYATFQQCHKDFSQFEERYEKVANEYYFRQQLLATHLAEAKSIDDVKSALSSKDGLYTELRDRPLLELSKLFDKLRAKIELHEFRSARVNERMSKFEQGLMEQGGLFALPYGVLPDITASDLPNVRQFGSNYADYVEDWGDVHIRPEITARCGPVDIFRIATGQPGPIGKAEGIAGFIDFAYDYVKQLNSKNPKHPIDAK